MEKQAEEKASPRAFICSWGKRLVIGSWESARRGRAARTEATRGAGGGVARPRRGLVFCAGLNNGPQRGLVLVSKIL